MSAEETEARRRLAAQWRARQGSPAGEGAPVTLDALAGALLATGGILSLACQGGTYAAALHWPDGRRAVAGGESPSAALCALYGALTGRP